ncbi:MAG: 2Fe-2S iron-sulfur cluster binding domain-containing protein [Candidatus Thiodiazotropha sp. (ex Troendleina suluensis)]|nr:2Fe-2S iron-sulfur cluster binding domain-containing protein [Candidatus Thiodiazotropha sp. (ex Troendleina suluensis)]
MGTLLSAGHDIPNECKAGTCQYCLIQHVASELVPSSQKGFEG